MLEKTILRNRVKELRARLELRQLDLATEIGVTRQTILAIEKGRLNPSVNIALKIARVVREPVDYVFYLAPDAEALLGGSDLGDGAEKRSLEPSAVWDFA